MFSHDQHLSLSNKNARTPFVFICKISYPQDLSLSLSVYLSITHTYSLTHILLLFISVLGTRIPTYSLSLSLSLSLALYQLLICLFHHLCVTYVLSSFNLGLSFLSFCLYLLSAIVSIQFPRSLPRLDTLHKQDCLVQGPIL